MTVVGWALRCVALVAIITSSQLYLFPAPLADDNGPDTNSENSDTSSENTEAGDEGYVVIVRPGKKKKKHRCDDCSVSDIYLPDPSWDFYVVKLKTSESEMTNEMRQQIDQCEDYLEQLRQAYFDNSYIQRNLNDSGTDATTGEGFEGWTDEGRVTIRLDAARKRLAMVAAAKWESSPCNGLVPPDVGQEIAELAEQGGTQAAQTGP